MKKTAVSLVALSAPAAFGAGAALAETPDMAWDLLKEITVEEIITETSYEVRKVFPASIEDGIEQFDISGYVVPLSEGPEITDLILVSDMGFCPFCGSPEHGTNLLVSMSEPSIGFEEGSRITLRGALEPVLDNETWQTAVLTNARPL